MYYTLTQTLNWAQAFTEYAPFTAGFGQEPAVSTANLIRSTLTSAPIVWPWNRAIYSVPTPTTKGTQDYSVLLSAIPDFGFMEKITLTDPQGKIWEVYDVYNNQPMPNIGSGDAQRPQAASILTISSTAILLRFVGVPNAAYTITLIYQKRPILFGPYAITAAGNASAGNTAYTGTFDPLAFPMGAIAQITGFQAHTVNNGSFTVVSCTSTTLTVANAGGVAETISAFANNFDWSPIPDSYQDIYNNLFLSEMFAVTDDARAQLYRQRGIAAFLAKSTGLSEMQKRAFLDQWLARGAQSASYAAITQQGNQGRAV